MKLAFLKKVRVILSLFFFIPTAFIFVDFAGILGAKVISALLYLQFVPSFLEFLDLVTLSSAGFLFVLLLTFLFGRVYCSTVCPLGTLMDISTHTARLFRRKNNYKFKKEQAIIRYGILILAAGFLVFQSILVVNMLDPFSIAGKIFSGLFRPVYYSGNNLVALILKLFDNYSLYPVPVKFISYISVILSSALFITIFSLAAFKGRWYCNVICPVGTLLGLVSRFSLFRLKIAKNHCTACGICTFRCKAECIDFKNYAIDFSRCVACYNCIGACPEGGISYELRMTKYEKQSFEYSRAHLKSINSASNDELRINEKRREEKLSEAGKQNRRNFLRISLAGTATLLAGKAALSKETARGISGKPVTPPGSVSIWHYTSRCIACDLCVSVCPTRVLQPTVAEFGLTGLFQPKMDFHTNFCNFECVKCSEVCPSGAILPVTKEVKQTIQIGISTFIKNLCIVVEKHTTCGACSEHCPTKAVEMIPYLGDLKIPRVNEKICIGCGACEYACPTKPEKAIYVESNLYHRVAMKPLKKIEDNKEKKVTEDFPF
jgi:ferredoxin